MYFNNSKLCYLSWSPRPSWRTVLRTLGGSRRWRSCWRGHGPHWMHAVLLPTQCAAPRASMHQYSRHMHNDAQFIVQLNIINSSPVNPLSHVSAHRLTHSLTSRPSSMTVGDCRWPLYCLSPPLFPVLWHLLQLNVATTTPLFYVVHPLSFGSSLVT